MELVILAAGAGRRYGGPKQLAPVGPAGEWLMDYTVHDAVAAGFHRLVVVVRADIEAAVRQRAARWPGRLEVEVVCQDRAGPGQPAGLAGTAHALAVAARQLSGDFATANADDLYGPGALAALAEHLRTGPPGAHAMVGLPAAASFCGPGPVRRAVCRLGPDARLVSVTEASLSRSGGRLLWRPLGEGPGPPAPLDPATLVSVNLWGLRRWALAFVEEAVGQAAGRGGAREVLLPEVVSAMLARGEQVVALPGRGPCLGLTHPEDLEEVRRGLAGAVAAGRFPPQLWPGH
ncbi:MAG TPA: NTP transferase domain-containing protein [Acidimicrobiales bacterium]|nr:NTP transferase domain-containing protein [Acidimicrobiales bacterium]